MKTIITTLAMLGTIGGAFSQDDKPVGMSDAATAVARITKSDQSAKWYMSNGWIYSSVKILRTDGVWAEIEYTYITEPPAATGVVQATVLSRGTVKGERKRCWVNVNHVISIFNAESEDESK